VLGSVSLLQQTLLQEVHTIAIKHTITQALMIFEILMVVKLYSEVK